MKQEKHQYCMSHCDSALLGNEGKAPSEFQDVEWRD